MSLTMTASRLQTGILRCLMLIIASAMANLASAQNTVVQVQEVLRAPLNQTVTLSGNLRSPKYTALSARVEGYINSIGVQAGDSVSAGQGVIQLDDEIPGLEHKRLQTVLKEAQSLMRDQQRRAEEAADLIEKDNFSRSQYEGLLAELSARQFRLEQFRIQTEIQQAQLERHVVRIPYDGVVVEKLVEVGQQINPGTPLLWLASMDPLWVEIRLPERYLGRIARGAAVRIQAAAGASWVEGQVSRIVPVSADGSRTFLVRSELSNPDWRYAPGMSARMELSLDGKEGGAALQVPADAISRRVDGETVVWVARESANEIRVESVRVTLGGRSESAVEITAGDLKVGDLVVIRGNEVLRTGQLVTIAPNNPESAHGGDS